MQKIHICMAAAEIGTQRSGEVRYQSSGLMSIGGGIHLAELGAHPVFLMRSLSQNARKKRAKTTNPRIWEMAIAMLRKSVRMQV
jgi:hypothetical protein